MAYALRFVCMRIEEATPVRSPDALAVGDETDEFSLLTHVRLRRF